MKIITGLGNPGSQYALNRHNIGYMILDSFAAELNLTYKAGKDDYYFASGKLAGEELFLLKPTTFMNNSGRAVHHFISTLKIDFDLKNLLIIYDDFQLPLGTIRLRENGSDGGHNGISSVIYHLITMDFPRMRIGIEQNEILKKEQFVDYVLSDFSSEEIEIINSIMPVYLDCVKSFLHQDIKKVMNIFNKNFLADGHNSDIS